MMMAATTAIYQTVRQPDERLRFARLMYYVGMATVTATALRPFWGLTLSDLVFLSSLIIVAGALVSRWTTDFGHVSFLGLFGVCAFSAGGLVSSLSSPYFDSSILTLLKFVYVTTVWFWLGTAVLRTPSQVALAMNVWVASAVSSASLGIAQSRFDIVLPGAPEFFRYIGRSNAYTLHPNDLGAICAVALAPSIHLATTLRSVGTRLLAAAGTITLIGGVVSSGSVDAYIVTAVIVGWIWLRRVSWTGRALMAIAALGLIVAVNGSLIASQQPASRIAYVLGTSSDASFPARIALYESTWAEISRHPLVGIGLDLESEAQYLPSYPEDTFLLAWVGAGILGLVGLVLLLVAIYREGRLALGERNGSLANPLVLAMTGMIVFSLASPILQQRFAFLPAALLFALRTCQLRAVEDPWRVAA